MVVIEKKENNFLFEIQGLHKLWTLKSQLTIPADHIVKVYKNTEDVSGYLGLRMPGTYIPGIITAGSYIARNGTIFCDFTDNNNIIVIELKDEHFKKLVVEVENVEKSIQLLMA